MALVLQDRVREISTTTGTGTVTLSGAYPGGYRTFASCVPDGSVVYYCIHNTANNYTDEWEVGYGTYSSNTLTRTTIYSSSNAGAAVNFSAGDKEVFITYPAEKAIYEEVNGETLINGGPITVVGSNVTSLPTLPAELGKFVGNVDLFAQIYNYNQNSGQNASADFVAYNSDTDVNGTTFFVDMGINSPNYSSVDYPIFTPHSGYVFSYGDGNTHPSTLFLGSGDGDVRIFAGGLDTNNTVATFGTDLSTTLEGALDVGSTLNVTGVTTLNALAYTSGNIAAAANSTVLVTKQYVDDATSNGFHVHNPVLVATTGNLTASYNNGTSGVGATLTNSGAQAALSIDGVSMNVNDRVLVWQQTTGTQNGVYVVTTVGSGSTNWVLTRASDADTAGEGNPNSLGGGDYFFVQSGSTLGYHSFVCTNTTTITFGSTAITFSEFSSVPAYTGGTNINVDGQTISLTGTVGPTNGGTGVNTVTTGDLLYGSASNTWGKLGLGAANKSLVVNGSGTQVEWNAVSLSSSGAVSGVLPEANGGTNNSSYVTGDTLYASGTNTLGKLGPNTTTTKKFLSQTGTGTAGQAPAWEQPAASDITGLAASATTDTTNASNISSGTLANARTTASSANGASTIVARDASGNFAANTITANLTGNVTGNTSGSAATLSTPRNFQISGGATAANVAFDGSAAVNLSVTAMNASVINTGTIGNAYTTASSSNGASTIVARDASGNFTTNNVSASNLLTSGLNATGDAYLASSTGSVGVGTSSPSYKLDVSGSAGIGVRYKSSGSYGAFIADNTSGTGGGYFTAYQNGSQKALFGVAGAYEGNTSSDAMVASDATGGAIKFYTSGSTSAKATLDSSGNLGLGVTPSAWTYKALQIGNASLSTSGSTGTTAYITGNGYYNGTNWIYQANDYASRYACLYGNGTHAWFTAPSGTAGNAITFTQAMTLDASGNLGIGTTSPSALLHVSNVSAKIRIGVDASSQYTDIFRDNATGYTVYNAAQAATFRGHIWQLGGSEAMRIDSSGNVGIGNASAVGKLEVYANSGTIPTIYARQDGAAPIQTWVVAAGTERARITSAGGFSVGTTADPGAGAIYATGNITAYYSSDRNLKENIKDVDGALDKVCAIGSKTFDWKDDYIAAKGGEDGYFVQKSDFGVVAQDVQAVFPQAVRTREDGTLAVDYEKLSTLAFGAIKELLKRVEALEAK